MNIFQTRESCPCCSHNNFEPLISIPYSDPRISRFISNYYEERVPLEEFSSYDYKIVKCNNCTLLYQQAILNDKYMFLLYEEWISAKQSLCKKQTADLQLYATYARELEAMCLHLKKAPHEIDILEYGSGWGFWANVAKAYGFNVTGIEISHSRTQFAKLNGLNILPSIQDCGANQYDYIYSNQVFEHVSHPGETLNNLAKLLKPGGIIYIQVPNGRGMQHKLLRESWEAGKDALHPLEHINCFNRKSLLTLAQQAGLSLRPPFFLDSLRAKPVVSVVGSYSRYVYDWFFSTRVLLQK